MPIEKIRTQIVEREVEKIVEVVETVIVNKIIEKPVDRIVIQEVEKYIDRPVETIKFIDREIPVIRTKIEYVEVERLVPEGADDCDCVTEIGFVNLWNSLMMMKSTEILKSDCLTSKGFVDLIMQNLNSN